MINLYWKTKQPIDFSIDKIIMEFDVERFITDNIQKMQAIEDAAMLKIVIDYLHNNGYTVTKDEESDSCG